jgi:predicted phosphoribosyltransferase
VIFANRQKAGNELGQALQKYKNEDLVVIGIPRGGVVVAARVAKILRTSLDVIIPRKIGAPHNPEVAIGAVTQDGTLIKDEALIKLLGITDTEIFDLAGQVEHEISRRVKIYRGGRSGVVMRNKTVIIVDDGIATGFTIKAALQSVRKSEANRLVLAVPVAPSETIAELNKLVDDLVCLDAPEVFYAVGQFYSDFDQTTDEEVIELLAEANLLVSSRTASASSRLFT